MDMQQFLSRHNIGSETLEGLVEKSSDYDLPQKVDYKKLYEEQLKENEKLKAQCECDDDGYAISDWFNEKMEKHIECHLSGDGEWGSLGFKNLQVFVDAYEKLKKPITNQDTRCPPFDVKVNVNYILELMEIKSDEIDFDDYELWEGFDEQVKENLMIELAHCIDGYINQYCTKPSHQLWNEYLVDEFSSDVDRLLQDDYFSQYIKYEEDENGDWKYTPIKENEDDDDDDDDE